MALRFPLVSTERVFIALFTAAVLSASDTAFYRAQLAPAASSEQGTSSVTADIKIHVVRDLAGKIVHGYVDFSLESPLAGSTTVSALSIAPASGATPISIPARHLPQHLSGSLHVRASAPVRSDNGAALDTLKALVETSTPVYVSATTSQVVLRGWAQRSTDAFAPQVSEDGIWKELDDAFVVQRIQANGQPPRFFRTFHLDPNSLQAVLRTAPLESVKGAKRVMSMPLPDGQFARFRIEESPVMEPALAAKFPNFKTYRGQGIDNPALSIRFDSTNGALHGIISGPEDMVQIQLAAPNDNEHYIVFYQRDLPPNPGLRNLHNDAIPHALELGLILPQAVPVSPPLGGTVRTYRLAIATTKGFTADPTFGGGGDGMAARMTTLTNVATMVNMMNALYERDVSVHFNLIANEMNLIFDTSSNADPGWADGNDNTMFNQAQGFIDAAAGNGNYDIGHVFGLSGTQGSAQGLASLGVVCSSTLKAQGVTLMGVAPALGATPPNYSSDVEVAEHEMAHEFNADHTTNSTTAFCAIERSAPTAYEVGSGSTILANAGSCPSQWPGSTDPQTPTEDVQINTDVYLHANTMDAINAYIAAGGGCFTPVTNTDTPPMVTAPANVTIPISTPFALTATGTSATGNNNLTYTWEELDLGTASPPEGDDGSRPLFRTFFPSASPMRMFPNLTWILNNSNQAPATIPCVDMNTFNCIPGEYLPVTNRTMNFRVTVRDNFAGGGGNNNASVQVTSTTAAGPFQVTQPNTAVTWQAGSTQTVTWNVANTNAAPVNAANVNILLSIDGGNTFPTMLAPNVPNNGSATISVPNTPTATARIEVQAVGNIFFDISDANFTIVQPGMAAVTVNAVPAAAGTGTAAALAPAATRASAAGSPNDKNIVNLNFNVDGKTFNGSQTFMFAAGSTHTISTATPQSTTNTRSEFSHWSNGGAISQTVKVGPGLTVYTALFNTQFELKTGVAPSGSGTVTPASGQFFADGSTVKVSAAANPGYVFSYWAGIAPPGQTFPGQKVLPELPNENVLMNSPKNLIAHFTEGPTNLAGIVESKIGPPNERVWAIRVNNSGPGIANNASVNSLRFKQTSGAACTPVVSTALPAVAGNIAPASTRSVPIDINFTGCPQNARFTINIGLTANDGKATGSIVRHNDLQ